MNIKWSLENLKIKVQQKNFLFVTGNVNETFLGKNREIHTLNDELIKINDKFVNHNSIMHFSFDRGAKNLLDNNSKYDSGKLLKEYMNEICDNIENLKNKDDSKKTKPKTFIVDFGDITMDSTTTGNDDLVAITKVLSAILTSQNVDYTQVTKNSEMSKIIFVMRDSGHILNFITNKNIEYVEVSINKPDADERRNLFSKLASRFDTIDSDELRIEGDVQNNAVGITDGLSLREILQISRIEPDEEITFKQLYNLTTLKSKDSSWEKLNGDEVKGLEEFLSKRVFGQEYAINKTAKTIRRSYLGLAGPFQGEESNKPKGILFYCGPTGVGKTELAKTVAEFVFKDKKRLVRFDMSEFAQEHSDQRLLGAPPGYIGFDGGGELTNVVKENPNCIILFDEIEKAHPKILDKFLQILEDGRLTSSKGELVNFSETFIIFTSNIGSSNVPTGSPAEIRNHFIKSVYTKFTKELKRPEILNRIGKGNIVPFGFIDEGIETLMLKSKLTSLNKRLAEKHHIEIQWNDAVLKDLINLITSDENYSKEDGGRGMLEIATKYVVDEAVSFILSNREELTLKRKGKHITNVKVKVQKDKLLYNL